MDELIERLRREAAAWDDWNEDHPDDAAVTTPPLLREAAAALEAAREDAERYRWLRDALMGNSNAPLDAFTDQPEPDTTADFDAAIDQARGKGGGEVGP